MPHGLPLLPSARLRRMLVIERGQDTTLAALGGHLGDDTVAGWLLLMLSIPALVPSPGVPIGVFVGLGIAAIGAQMLAGSRKPHLPQWIGRRRLSYRELRGFVIRVRPWLKRLEVFARPHPAGVSGIGLLRAMGIIAIVNGILIALPIPLGNTAPAVSTLAVALGLILHDGRMVWLGFALAVIAWAVTAALLAGTVWIVDWAIA
ncbi:MAG: exopolysaccharide biosynthesis protein [Rhodospirillales bacterium]|jgi:hypothetical protein|nr:exopolysaccharide biosynthesis protein [Rhodospirillales bacterium]